MNFHMKNHLKTTDYTSVTSRWTHKKPSIEWPLTFFQTIIIRFFNFRNDFGYWASLFRITFYITKFYLIICFTHDSSSSLGVNCTASVKNIFSSLFSTKVNSKFLEPTDEPFKSPSPFNNNLGACFVGISYLFLN